MDNNTAVKTFAKVYAGAQYEAWESLRDSLMEFGNITSDEAHMVANAYIKYKMVKFDRVNRSYNVKHGAYLSHDIINNALENIKTGDA